MPLLGLGSQLVEKNLPMPNGLYFELATWSTINFTYTFQNERMLLELVAGARAPDRVARLLKVIRRRLAIASRLLSKTPRSRSARRSTPPCPSASSKPRSTRRDTRRLHRAIRARTDRLHEIAGACIRDAGLKPSDIHTIFFTGGSGRVPAVRDAITRAAPDARATEGSDFLSVR